MIYAGVAIVFNVMYSTSKVLSFNAGHIVMASSLVAAWVIGELKLPAVVGILAAIGVGALLGIITYEVGVRRLILKGSGHLWILSTLALATIIHNVAGLTWGTEPRPFPRLFDQARNAGISDQKFWLPILGTLLVAIGLGVLIQRTLLGKLFTAISNDEVAATARGIPVERMRLASFALAGAVGGVVGYAAGQLTFAYFSLGMTFTLNGFIAIAVGGLGSNRGAIIGGLLLGVVGALTTYWFGSNYHNTITMLTLLLLLVILPDGIFGKNEIRNV
jgi:branched-chain amino acid transport system permease protein